MAGVGGCDCLDCEAERETDKRLERQRKELERLDSERKKEVMPNKVPYGYMGGYDSGDKKGTWLGIERSQIPEFKVPLELKTFYKAEESTMAAYNVTITRNLTKPQADGSLLPIEQLLFHGQVIAGSQAMAGVIAGKDLKETAEELSTAKISVSQITQ